MRTYYSDSMHRNGDFIESLLCLFIIAKCCHPRLLFCAIYLGVAMAKKAVRADCWDISQGEIILSHFRRFLGGFYHLWRRCSFAELSNRVETLPQNCTAFLLWLWHLVAHMTIWFLRAAVAGITHHTHPWLL